jgi:hypothetical protein
LTLYRAVGIMKTMAQSKRVTADLPEELLGEAMAVTGKDVTATLIEGLILLRQPRALRKAMELRGKLELDIDLGVSRERP